MPSPNVGAVRAVRGPSVSGVAFGAAGQTTLVVWSDGGEATVLSPPPGKGAKAETLAGEALAWGPDGLRLDGKPILVTVPIAPDHALRLMG